MKREEKSVDELLRTRLPVSLDAQVESAVERVLLRNQAEILEAALRGTTVRTPAKRRTSTLAVAAAMVLMLLAAAAVATLMRPSDDLATVQSLDGSLYSADGRRLQVGSRVSVSDMIRSPEGSGAVLALMDGSLVEIRSQAELSLERAVDGVRIQLHQGGLIVSAAKQPSGHLYVQTRDVSVSVVGTVFYVNAEEEGSRVAVIQGEVRVQQGGVTKKLVAGKQIATSPMMEPRSVSEEISWSRSAPAHVALLQQNTTPPPVPSARATFDVVSIKPYSRGGGPVGSVGFACHGVDGKRSALFGNGQLIAPLGRCVGSGNVFVVYVIALAYGKLSSQYVSGGPDWIRPAPPPLMLGRSVAFFQMEGVAENPSTATLDDLMQMLQTMLADRFRLKVHHETQESPGWSLAVAKGGLKILEAASNDQESPHLSSINGRGMIKGKSRLDALAQLLSQVMGAPIIDKTGLASPYTFEFLVPSRGGGGERGGPEQGRGAPLPAPFADRIAEISDVMEDRLGLILQKEKSVPVEILVIDEIEMPTPN